MKPGNGIDGEEQNNMSINLLRIIINQLHICVTKKKIFRSDSYPY